MHDNESILKDPKEPIEENSGVSRRDFLKISTIAAAGLRLPVDDLGRRGNKATPHYGVERGIL